MKGGEGREEGEGGGGEGGKKVREKIYVKRNGTEYNKMEGNRQKMYE